MKIFDIPELQEVKFQVGQEVFTCASTMDAFTMMNITKVVSEHRDVAKPSDRKPRKGSKAEEAETVRMMQNASASFDAMMSALSSVMGKEEWKRFKAFAREQHLSTDTLSNITEFVIEQTSQTPTQA